MTFVLDFVAKPTFIVISAAVLTMLLRRSSAAVRHAIWILAMAASILVPLAALLVPQFEWSVLPKASTGVTFLRIEDKEVGSSQTATIPDLTDRMTFRLKFIWVLGISFVWLRLLMATLAVRRLTRNAIVPMDDHWRKLMTEVRSAFHIRRPVRLLFTEGNISPMTWGVWRHTILMPSTADAWSNERRRLVLAHEIAHVKRNDGLLQVVVQVVCSVYWFNPLVWYAAHRLRNERERACDDRVLGLGTEAADYADHLVQVVRGLRDQRSLSFASVSIAQLSQLESRVISILDSATYRRTLSKTGTILVCMVAAVVTTSIAAIGIAAQVPLPPVFVSSMKIAPAAATPTKPAATPQRTRIGNDNAVRNNEAIPPQIQQSSKPSYTQKDDPAPVRVGDGVTPPTVIYRVEPEYTEEARQAKYQGTVVVRVIIHKDGTLAVDEIVRELDYGLTQRAIEALEQWKFKPGMKNGEPVAVSLTMEVNFNLK
jgi:TonB family protein